MKMIMKAVDGLEEVMGHSPHPAIVALPLGAFALSNVSDILAAITGDERFDATAEFAVGAGLIGTAAAAITGLRDYGYIPSDRQPNHDIATTHALGNLVVGGLFAGSYIMRVSQKGRPGVLPRLLGLAGGALSIYTGWLGGKLVSELGEGVKPVMKQMARAEAHPDGRSPAPITGG